METQSTLEQQTRNWALFLHLSQFAGFIVPLAGFVVPIVIWQVKKTELPGLEPHGKMVTNWIISALIYSAISGILVFVVIGVLLLIVLFVLGIIFPIIGAVKAGNDEVWSYPLTIKFIK